MARIGLCFSALLALSSLAFSQVDTSFNRINLSYTDYLSMVVRGNLEYAVEKYSINIADAKIEAAKVFQNPSLAFDWSRDEENYSLSAEISKTFELGQKRKARINLAKSERSVANAMLLDYLRNLQADATLDYLAALKQNYLFRVMLNSYQTMKELSDGDSVRFSLGSINAIDATQSKIEAGVLRNDLFQIEVERNNSFINLSTKTGTYISDTLFFPVGKFEMTRRHFAIDELLTNALNSRADLLAAKSNLTYNQNSLILTRRERMMDIDLKTGTKNSYLNTGSSSPNATEIFAGIAIPLKFSNFNKGEIKIAKFQIEQGELLYKKVEMKIQTEVLQAYNQYTSLCKQVGSYNQGLLDQAKMVLNGKMYSYSRGETSLLEVLNAQRTYNDLQTAYYETLYKCNEALVELERAAGIWDIEL
ncbi:outer membrane protein, cobalt-zinc-cadmium efflux system [Williamwhitmania taraxaci]|uniref:Outer membrane protein, cobalt-zinc-cadmium efflux system n=2 Tax=Williamwhitmania taraxaci TaxID=1640674 RepID=A0A1G6MGW8_9BACT|nr:outer membrane protein, cobalt-zinc-cadmium efflux system [Williamwhitmania taraxaci]